MMKFTKFVLGGCLMTFMSLSEGGASDCFSSVKTSGNFNDYEVITFWGVLEYLKNPNSYLGNSYSILKNHKGMIFCEVPRFNSFSTYILKLYNETAVRHLTPWCRLSCFTDESLNTIYGNNRFQPIAAWYYGLDAYEWSIQLSYNQNFRF